MDVHCGEIKRGEIYWVDFGKTKGSEQGGKRPALVVQNNIGNKHSPTTIVVAITSKRKPNLPTHVILEKDALNGLSSDSLVTCEQIKTIDKARLLDKIGEISPKKQKEVNRAMQIRLQTLLMEG